MLKKRLGARAATRPLCGAALILAASAASAAAQTLHVNDRWKDCAIVLAPSLTQDAWRRFVGEAALVVFFRPLASARPLGRGKFEVGAMTWNSRVDDSSGAWNDTFSHPDSMHWLYDGDALPIPALMVRAGITDRLDIGVSGTKNFNANYGMLGAHVQYGLLDDVEHPVAVAGRLSTVRLLGPEDASLAVYGVDLVASRRLSAFSPYVIASAYLARGHEHTSKVNLQGESVFGVQGTAGVAASVSRLRLGAELNLSRVTTYSFKIGFGT
jgi:hypothetical protein